MASVGPVVCVCVPTFNEAGTIGELLSGVEEHCGYPLSVVVVDDGSEDGTIEIVREMAERYGNVVLVVREGKLGLGSAIVEGFRRALSLRPRPSHIVTMDADLSHDPAEIPRLVESCVEGSVVVGSRYVEGGEIVGWSARRRAVSYVANLLARHVGGIPLRDCTSGFRCYSSDLVAELLGGLRCGGYGIQIETLFQAVRRGHVVTERPIRFRERRSGESKLGAEDVWGFLSLMASCLGARVALD